MSHMITNTHRAGSLVPQLFKDLRLVAVMALAQGAFRLGSAGVMAGTLAEAAWTQWWVSAVGLAPLVLSISFGMRVLPGAGLRRWAALGALAVLAGTFSFVLCMSSFGEHALQGLPSEWLAWWRWRLFLALLLVAVYEGARRNRCVEEEFHQAQLRRPTLERELILAQLQVLHAQMEPHFLFNSLANLRRLLRTDVPAAHSMLSDLLRFLGETLPRLRDERSTLAHEMVLVRAFLSLHKVRMGTRLSVEFDIPTALLAYEVPPMAVLTLVENALKHGLHPLPQGGAIRIAAHASGSALMLSVADTGCGLGAASGQGTGLANLRARLLAMYGVAASLSLRRNAPHGLVATLALPEVAR
ncbi:MAG: histidine kinase [Pseudomonadota bacterium]